MSKAAEAIERIEAEYRASLERHRSHMLPVRVLAARKRFVIAIVIGVVVGFLTPADLDVVSRALLGWNAAIVGYLGLVLNSIAGAGPRRIRQQAQLLDDGRVLMLCFSILAAVASIGAIVVELSSAKDAVGLAKAGRLGLAGGTILCSWTFIHTVFALHYAHEYYLERKLAGAEDGEIDAFDFDHDGDVDDDDAQIASEGPDDPRGGLIFPGTQQPVYMDFFYFSFIVGVAAQTADVELSTRAMRRISLAHSILAFFFNTAILALTINLAAGMF
jgi:uncharacterized membrane protein